MTEVKKTGFSLSEVQAEVSDIAEMHAAELEAQSGGNFEIPEGTALALITGYIELGIHENGKGKDKNKGKLEVLLFDIKEGAGYTHTKTEDGKTTISGSPLSHNINHISSYDTSRFYKERAALLKAVGLSADASPIELLGKTFKVKVVHNTNPKDEKQKFVNLDMDSVLAPYSVDPDTGDIDESRPINLPIDPNDVTYRLFTFNCPTIAQWDSIYIDGTYTVKDEKTGKEEEKSKNFIQETIRRAKNFEGSAIESLLMTAGSSNLPKATRAKDAVKETKSAPKNEAKKAEPAKEEAQTAQEVPNENAEEIAKLEESIRFMISSGFEDEMTAPAVERLTALGVSAERIAEIKAEAKAAK